MIRVGMGDEEAIDLLKGPARVVETSSCGGRAIDEDVAVDQEVVLVVPLGEGVAHTEELKGHPKPPCCGRRGRGYQRYQQPRKHLQQL